MTERKPTDIRKAIDGELSGVGRDPFLYQRVLNIAQQEPPRRRPRRLTVALVALALLMLSTAAAVAGNWLGVRYFLTDRLMVPVNVEDAYVAHPVSQSCDSEWFNVTALDAYWYGFETEGRESVLSMSLHMDARQPEVAFCFETDIGKDGESFDMIWWRGSVLPVIEWLGGRECIRAEVGSAGGRPESAQINGQKCLVGIDYVHEEQGVTVLMEWRGVPDLSQGATITVPLFGEKIAPDETNTYLVPTGEQEYATLTVTLPPMQQGPMMVIGDDEPNA